MNRPARDIVDYEQLRDVYDMMGNDAEMYIQQVLDHAQGTIEKMYDSISRPEEICSLAHKLKGSMSNLGAIDLAESCRQLEISVLDPAARQTDTGIQIAEIQGKLKRFTSLVHDTAHDQ